MLVVADLAKVLREHLGQLRPARHRVVFLALLAGANRLLHLPGHLRKDVAFVERFDRTVDDFCAGGGIERDVRRCRSVLTARGC